MLANASAGFLYGPRAFSPPASPQLGQASAAVLGCKRSSRTSPCQPQVHDQEVTERPVLAAPNVPLSLLRLLSAAAPILDKRAIHAGSRGFASSLISSFCP